MSQPSFSGSSPMKRSVVKGAGNASIAGETGKENLEDYRGHVAQDMAHRAVLSDVRTFCDKFFPVLPHTKRRPNRTINPFWRLEAAGGMLERQIQTDFADAVKKLVPGLVMAVTSDRPDDLAVDPTRQKGDAAFFYPHSVPEDGKPRWGDQIISVEFKQGLPGNDPFDEKVSGFSDAISRTEVRGQLISYAALLLAMQQREAFFSLFVIGRKCRFIRWDRSGAIATKLIDYYSEWKAFCDILWRIGKCSECDDQLGLDPSATRIYPGTEEFQAMADIATTRDGDVKHNERIVHDDELNEAGGFDGEFDYIKVVDKDDGKTYAFWIAKPVFVAKGLAGRGTRGYVAWWVERRMFVWLKDSWRAAYALVQPEGDILKTLNTAGIPNIPTLICHGDVLNQKTLTPDWWRQRKTKKLPTLPRALRPSGSSAPSIASGTSTAQGSKRSKRKQDTVEEPTEDDPEPDPSCPMRLHRHYRMVVREVAKPLKMFQHERQLFNVLDDILAAHEAAANGKGLPEKLLHRDISAGNILIYPRLVVTKTSRYIRLGGMLADWEMSKPIPLNVEDDKPRQPERTGTWQYQAAILLIAGSCRRAGIPEELESVWLVSLYHAIRYLPSNLDDLGVARFIHEFFDTYHKITYADLTFEWVCSDFKSTTLGFGKLRKGPSAYEVVKFNSESLNSFIQKMLDSLCAHYAVRQFKEEEDAASDTNDDDHGDSTTADEASTGIAQSDTASESTTAFVAPCVGDEDEDEDASSPVTGKTTEAKGPSVPQLALAVNMAQHAYMRSQVRIAAKKASVDTSEKRDRIPDTWMPPRNPVHRAEARGKKRPKFSSDTQTAVDGAHTAPVPVLNATKNPLGSGEGSSELLLPAVLGQSDIAHVRRRKSGKSRARYKVPGGDINELDGAN
ncbi:uncharacterized protein BXZ73DRAFT_78546 [Epithele typhae]|uniref:uncharacterized protein n=1 Tax=Epithele typhae TaxID=378194 RepID=UPI0020083B3D|nr:uncharacterized protein BXZ73DRAFT_78546 [Epithele typhae]KAH9927521.1 hypothetical protein BXZ73DRAFT_78546 [Epithele typhae]